VRFLRFGDRALRAELPRGADPRAVLEALRACGGVIDAVVTERHALVVLGVGALERLEEAHRMGSPGELEDTLGSVTTRRPGDAPAREHRVRVRYDGEDLSRVAALAGTTPREVALRHAGRAYTVACIGFLPGFAYLAEVDARIAVPRLAAPRPRVPAGAVGLAGARTGVYPFASPGGWNLVGTALDLVAFDAARGAVFALGDRVTFDEVT